jgi:hypothetical protein
MKALTVRQPYASRIVLGEKRVENRSRTTYMRGTVLVHAGAVVHDHFAEVRDVYADLPLSAIVGTVDIVGSHSAALCERHSCFMGGGLRPGTDDALGNHIPDGPLFHWVLSNPVRFDEPIPASGALGFWQPGAEALEAAAKAVQR